MGYSERKKASGGMILGETLHESRGMGFREWTTMLKLDANANGEVVLEFVEEDRDYRTPSVSEERQRWVIPADQLVALIQQHGTRF